MVRRQLRTIYGIVHIREPKTRRMAGHAAQQHVLVECPGICQLVNATKASIPDHRLDTAIWNFTAAQHFANFQRQLRSLGVSHQHYTLRGGAATDHWLQYCVSHHNYDAEVGGPLKRPLKDTIKKARSYFTKTGSPRKLRTVSALSQSSHLVSLQNKTTESPATDALELLLHLATCPHVRIACLHHVPRRCTCSFSGPSHPQPTCSEEFTPFCAAASSNGALPTPSRLSERYLYHSVTWDKNQEQADDAHDTSTDTLGWIMSSHAYGGRALELQIYFELGPCLACLVTTVGTDVVVTASALTASLPALIMDTSSLRCQSCCSEGTRGVGVRGHDEYGDVDITMPSPLGLGRNARHFGRSTASRHVGSHFQWRQLFGSCSRAGLCCTGVAGGHVTPFRASATSLPVSMHTAMPPRELVSPDMLD